MCIRCSIIMKVLSDERIFLKKILKNRKKFFNFTHFHRFIIGEVIFSFPLISFRKGDSMIRTSINIGSGELQKLKKAAKTHGVDIETLILALLRHMAKKMKRELVTHKAAEYQKPRDPEEWKCLRVYWESEEYEFLIDMRKVHKKSVSLLIAEAIVVYLNDDGSIVDDILDKNSHHRYKISKFIKHNMLGCTFMWIMPISP